MPCRMARPAETPDPPRVSAVSRVIEEPAPKRPPYFWWLLANLLALCFAVVSWTVCLQVFGNPEIPRNYGILRKLGRLPELKRYTVLDVPNGNLLEPRGLYAKFFERTKDKADFTISDQDLAGLNKLYLRNYLTNFERSIILTYIEGEYVVEKVRELGPGDFIASGFAVRARAMIKPDDFTKPAPYPVVIEYLFPLREKIPSPFRPGDPLTVKKSPNCAAVLHAARIIEDDDTPALCLTVVPIAYGPYRVGDAISFTIEPPAEVNPAADFPVFQP